MPARRKNSPPEPSKRAVQSAADGWRGFAGVWACAFLLRAIFIGVAQDRDWPFSIFFYGDSQHFRAAAEALAAGQLYDAGIPYHPPLFPLSLGALFSLFGGAAAGALPYKLLMAALNSLGVALGWRWLREMLGEGWGDLGGVLLAGSFGWYLFSANFCSEALYVPLLAGSLLVLGRAGGRLGARRAVGLGLLTGLATLTRAEHLTLALLCAAAWWPARDRTLPASAHLRAWGLLFAVALAVVAPWSLRNWIRLGEWNRAHPSATLPRLVPVTIYGPLNFALANHPDSDGGFDSTPLAALGGDGSLDVENPAQRELLLHGYRAGGRWIADHPAAALRLAGRKLSRWLDGLRLGWGARALPAGDAGIRPPVDVLMPAGGAWLKWLLAALLAAGGGLALRGAPPAARIALAVVLHRLLVTLAFFGYARGLLIILPAVFALVLLALRAGCAFAPGAAAWARRAALALALLLAIDGFLRLVRPPRNYLASGSTDAQGKLIQDAAVTLHPLP